MYCKAIFFLIMTVDDKIRDEKNCNMILTEKQQKYQHYHREKYEYEYLDYEYLTSEKILPSYQRQIIEQAKFKYSPLRKAFEKQTNKNKQTKKD